MPGFVQSYDHTDQTATIQPAVTQADGSRIPPITKVPILFPGSSAWAVTWSLAVGDEVWLFFAERDIDEWLEYGGYRAPGTERIFDWSDAVAWPSPVSRPNVITQASATDLVISARSSKNYIQLKSDGEVVVDGTTIYLGEGATEYVAMADLVLKELQEISIHLAALGRSYTPGSVAATIVKAE
jgi:hypothetical protein